MNSSAEDEVILMVKSRLDEDVGFIKRRWRAAKTAMDDGSESRVTFILRFCF